MRISYAIQAHPSRADMAAALADHLPDAEVVFDPDPTGPRSAWRCYRACLEATPGWATHRVILQDDTLLCDRFDEACPLVVAARPDDVVAMFVQGLPHAHALNVLDACGRGERWAMLDNQTWCPAVALSWPAALVPRFLAYAASRRYAPGYGADDQIIGEFLQASRRWAWATVPSLVEHPDMVDSVGRGQARRGTYSGRMAACFVTECGCDPLEIDWAPL